MLKASVRTLRLRTSCVNRTDKFPAARVLGAPVEPAEASQVPTANAVNEVNGESAPAKAADVGKTADSAVASPTEPITPGGARETAPKSTKRSSIFGNFFNKKDNTTPTSPSTETAPAVPAKDSETPVTSPTAPQIEDPVSKTPADTTTAPAAASTETPATAADSSATPVADNAKPARRTSFFNTLGSKKERKPDVTSDTEAADGEGKKASKFGGLFRKPSRAVPNGKTTTTESSNPGTEALKAAVEPSTSTAGKEAPVADEAANPTETTAADQSSTPIKASA